MEQRASSAWYEFTVARCVVQDLVDVVEATGASRTTLLRATQVERELEDVRVPCDDLLSLIDAAVELTNDPALGLHWAETNRGHAFGPLSLMLAHSPTLRHAFASLAHYGRLVTDRASFELLEAEHTVTVRCVPPPVGDLRMRRFAAEMSMARFVRLVRSFDGEARPHHVDFDYPAPSYSAEYARVFRGKERFGQAHNEVTFDRSVLDSTSPHRDPDVHEALRAIVERRVLELTASVPFALRVRECLVDQPPGRTSMANVAGRLGLSVRSLRRRLEEEGEPYHAIVASAQAIVAKKLLRSSPPRTIQEVAFELGFSDVSSFHRAFRRWTGMTPLAYKTGCAS